MRRRTLTLLAATLAIASNGTAAEDCLTGSTVLADQRALVTLRSTTETDCPCASFAGGPGADRGAYQRCARGVLESAVGGGMLRAECATLAKRVNRGATCGSSNIACGRVISGAKPRATCKLQPASRCVSRGAVTADACGDATRCADVTDWSGGTCEDVRTVGPYTPGVRIVTLTKDSVFTPGTPRTIETAIWYPAAPGSGPIDPLNEAVIDAPLDISGGPYPIVMFSHGSCGYPQQSTFLTPNLAAHGFIVVAPAHTGNTIDQFPTCGTPAAQTASFAERPADIKYALDAMLAADLDPGSPFFGAIDETRLAMTGHSFGGLTTHLVVTSDPRYDVAIPMAPATLFDPLITIPSLTMLGALDTTVNNVATKAAFTNDSAPKFVVEIAEVGHYAFSDGCFIAVGCSPPATLDQNEAHLAVQRWVLPFLRRYLQNDTRFDAFLQGPPPAGTAVDRVI